MGRRFLFVGPTLPDAERLLAGSGIEVRPPVASGDLLRLPAAPGDVVGVVDGYFHELPALRHKEILALLADGVRVLGAASMGALRAAELHRFGMRGIGGIFDDYAAGRLTADDEVTLRHGTAEDGYRAMSEPLVNIRATLRLAVNEGLLDEASAGRVIATLRETPYPDRTYHRVLALAGAPSLAEFLRTRRVDRKRADALALVRVMVAPQIAPAVDVTETVYLRRWRLASSAHLAALRASQVLAADFPRFFTALIVDWLVARCSTACVPESAAPDADRMGIAIAHAGHAGHFDPAADQSELPFIRGWVTPSESKTLSPTEMLGRCLVRGFRFAPGIPPEQLMCQTLRTTASWNVAVQTAQRADELNMLASRVRPEFAVELVRPTAVRTWLAQMWRVDDEDMEFAALDRGFDSLSSAMAAGRWLYLLGHTEPRTWTIDADEVRRL